MGNPFPLGTEVYEDLFRILFLKLALIECVKEFPKFSLKIASSEADNLYGPLV
jgi:hypothetical protein